VGTFVTNYVIAGVGVVAFLWHYNKSVWVALYFLLTGLGYGIAGVGHQVIESSEDNGTRTIIAVVSILHILVGGFALQYWAVPQTKYRISLVVLFAAVFGVAVSLNSPLVLEIYLLLSYLALAGHSGYLKDYLASLGCVTIIAGALTQVSLARKCGDSGYETCWEDCPLPNPLKFNHNSLFHVIVAFGLLLQMIGRYDTPPCDRSNEEAQDEQAEGLVPTEPGTIEVIL
jgi:hypothetical protein